MIKIANPPPVSWRHASCVVALGLTLFSSGAALAQQGDAARHGEQQISGGLRARQGEGAFQPLTFDRVKAPLGPHNNNWGAIKGPNLHGRWPVQTGANTFGFARFDDPA